MIQFAFVFGALAGVFCALAGVFLLRRLRPAAPGWVEHYDETHLAAFEQWPTTAFVLHPESQRILAANPAALRNTGHTLEELRALKFGELFRAEGINGSELVRRVRAATLRQLVQDTPLRHCHGVRTC